MNKNTSSGGFLFIILLLLVTTGRAQVNMRELLSYPYPSNLCTNPATGRMAWTFNIEGKQDIYFSRDHGNNFKKITEGSEDDGQVISDLCFSPDGAWLVYIKGGEPGGNWSRDVPVNPNSSTVKKEVQLWSIRLDDNTSQLLAKGISTGTAAVSPDNKQVAFLKNEAVWTVSMDGTENAKQLFYARGTTNSISWSPDGDRLLFVSQRGDHSFIGVYQKNAPAVTWIDPSFSMDVSPRWSPDGKAVVFIRLSPEGGKPDSILTATPQSWQIRIANLNEPKSCKIWQSPLNASGAVPATHGRYNLHWAANNRIIFLSVMDNWPHLYSIPVAGGDPLLLTPGNFMTEYITLSPDRRKLVFSANTGADREDTDRRHIGIVSVDKPDMKMLTSGTGIEVMPLFLQNDDLAFISSSSYRPAMPSVISPGKKMKIIGTSLLSPVYANGSPVIPKQVVFTAPDGTPIHGQLFMQDAKKPGRRPAVLYIHGGPKRQMLLGWHFSDYYAADYAVNQALAKLGFVVLSVNYRLGIGYGNNFNQPPHAGRNGSSEYQDILAAGKWLSGLPAVDPARVGVYGGSYGGYLTALALGKNSDVFAAGVDIHGVHTRLPKDKFTTPYEAAPDAALADTVAWRSSPIAYAETWRSPVLFIHGDDDRNVGFSNTINLLNRLEQSGVACETIVIPDDTHHWLLHKNLITVCEATVDFLVRKLNP